MTDVPSYSAYMELMYQAYADEVETPQVEQKCSTDEGIGPFSKN
jgi:hypothetical protein